MRVDVAGDLHDHVIQELFTLGLRIQGDAARSESAVAEQINGYAETLDEVIAKIRTSIFGLQRAGRPAAACAGRPGHDQERGPACLPARGSRRGAPRHQRPSHNWQGRPDHMTGERDQT
jgi:hypothetical protein